MAKVLGFLVRHNYYYYTLHRSDLAARAAPLDPRLACIAITGIPLQGQLSSHRIAVFMTRSVLGYFSQ